MRRALVIGLGGCGCRVVQRLKERVEWRYGGLEKTPFLQLLGIDTAEDAGLEGEDLFVHMTVHREDFRRLIDEVRLGRERPDIEPHRWLDIQVVGDKTEISDGAGGIRMVGRLAFLFPTNFNAVVARLRAKLEKLRTMTDEEASKAFGETLQLSEGLDIYVVATLCAGTGSSVFLDMGYLLRRLTAYFPLPTRTTAIITLPPLTTTDIIKLRNTYVALCELDYFSRDGVTYRAKFPDEPRLLERSDRPYDFVYLVSPDRLNRPSLPDHFALEAAIAEYLFADVFLDETKIRDGRRDDMANYAFTRRMPDGAPLRFLTFGLSVLQFPAQQIQDACAYLLTRRTLDDYLTDREPSVTDIEGLMQQVGLSGEGTVRRELLSPEGDPRGENYNIQIAARNRLDWLMRNYQTVTDLDTVKQQLLCGFGEGAPLTGDEIPFGRFRQVIEGNRERLKRDLPQRILDFLKERFLTQLSVGIQPALKAIQKVREAVAERLNALQQSNPNEFFQYAENRCSEFAQRLYAAERDWLLALPIPYRGLVRRRLLARWRTVMEEWVQTKLDAYAIKEEIAVLESLQNDLSLIEQRLRHWRDYANAFRQAAQDGYNWTLRPPRVPGIILFDEDIVQREYKLVLPNEQAERTAMAEVLQAGLGDVWGALTRPLTERHENWLDNDLEIGRRVRTLTDPQTRDMPFLRLQRDRIWKRLKDEADKKFEAKLRERGDVIERFMERATDLPAQLKNLLDEAAVFLPINLSDPNFQQVYNPDRQEKRWVFWLWGSETPTTRRGQEFWEALQKALRETQEQEELAKLSDKTAIFVLTELGGFPVRLIQGVEEFVERIRPEDRVQMWSRKDLPRWLRLKPTEPRCEELLVTAYAWQLMRLQVRDGNRWHECGEDRLPVVFPEAARMLEENIDIRRRLDRRIQQHLQEHQTNPAKLEELYHQLIGLNETQLNMLGVEELTEEQARAIALRFIQRQDVLKRLHEQMGELAPYRHFATDEEAQKDGFPQAGYYCANCHYFFGPDIHQVPKFCPRCQAV